MPPVNDRTFIGKMIASGKALYLLDLLPSLSDQEKMGYTNEKYQWAVANESNLEVFYGTAIAL